MDSEPRLSLYVHVLRTLEALGIEYVVIGAFAGTSYGITRTTYDVDIVVDLRHDQVVSLAAAYPPPRYYADPEQMRDSVRRGTLFNIIDTTEGTKVDLIPLTMPPGYGWALRGRVRRPVPLDSETAFEAWFARPDDVIIGKLMAWDEGRSYKHESDIGDILAAMRTGEGPALASMFDLARIDRWVANLTPDAQALWEDLKRSAGLG